MTNILVVLGSVRESRLADGIAEFVTNELAQHEGVESTIVDFTKLELPFMTSPLAPASPDFAPTDKNVIEWTKLVAEADGVVFVTPEYNHAITPVQKNAIDWIKNEWKDKPTALVAYGWYGGEYSIADARRVLEFLETKLGDSITRLYFAKQLAPDGSVLDEAEIKDQVKATVDELIAAI